MKELLIKSSPIYSGLGKIFGRLKQSKELLYISLFLLLILVLLILQFWLKDGSRESVTSENRILASATGESVVAEAESKEVNELIVEPVVNDMSGIEIGSSASRNESLLCVDIQGAVNKPGVYCLEDGSMIYDVIKVAGGFSTEKYASELVHRALNLSTKVVAAQKIYIPFRSETVCSIQDLSYKDRVVATVSQIGVESDNAGIEILSNGGADVDLEESEKEGDGDGACVDLNLSSKDALMQLPGVGDATATAIIAARPFKVVEDLLEVKGIGESKFNTLKDLVCVK